MREFYDFAGGHPFLTLILASMILGTVVRLIPWSKKEDRIPDDRDDP